MSSTNENNASFESEKKIGNPKYYEEIDLISSNPKISNAMESSGIIEVSSKGNISNKLSINTSIISPDLIYGNPIDVHNPRNIGSMKAFFYINNNPLIVIGPDCKFFIII